MPANLSKHPTYVAMLDLLDAMEGTRLKQGVKGMIPDIQDLRGQVKDLASMDDDTPEECRFINVMANRLAVAVAVKAMEQEAFYPVDVDEYSVHGHTEALKRLIAENDLANFQELTGRAEHIFPDEAIRSTFYRQAYQEARQSVDANMLESAADLITELHEVTQGKVTAPTAREVFDLDRVDVEQHFDADQQWKMTEANYRMDDRTIPLKASVPDEPLTTTEQGNYKPVMSDRDAVLFIRDVFYDGSPEHGHPPFCRSSLEDMKNRLKDGIETAENLPDLTDGQRQWVEKIRLLAICTFGKPFIPDGARPPALQKPSGPVLNS